jgi:integrase
MATIRKRVNKKGVSYQVDYYDPDGKRVMKIFKKKKDAEKYLNKVGVTKEDGTYEEIFGEKKEQPTFNQLADDYVKNYGHQKSFITFKRHAVRYLREAFGEKKLKDLSYLDLETYRNKRKATPLASGKIRTDATVNREMAALKHMLNKAVEWRKLTTSPFHQGSKLTYRENNQRQRYLMEEEMEKLLNSCSPHLQPIVEIALHTGMRKGEILKLKWDQVRDGFIYLKETKTGKSRQIPLDGRAAEVFRVLQIKNKWKSPYVFVGPEGEPWGDVKKAFMGACRRAGIEDFHFHDLRHTFASHLVMKGANLKAVQRLLGHSDSKMTDRYSHLSPDHLRESVNLLGDLPIGKEMVNILPLKTLKAGAGTGGRTPGLLITNQLLYH